MPLPNLRRLAAVDMHGTHGSERRRRIIIAEFFIGSLAGLAIGIFVVVNAEGLPWTLLGVAVLGIGANYAPLATQAFSLRAPAAVRGELAGSDVSAELRRYSVAQLWVFVPFLFLALAIAQHR